MANELRLSLTLSFDKGGASIQKSKTPSLTVTGTLFAHGVQNVGLVEEELTLVTGMGTLGYVYLHNLDATNFISAGSVTGELGIKVKPGEIALFRTNGAGIFVLADTAACDIEYVIIED